jgi:tetratricopeptide (TPR) repeat protein
MFVLFLTLWLGAGLMMAVLLDLPHIVASQHQQAQVEQLRQEAQDALNSGDYDRAVMSFNALLELVPGDPQAKKGLEETSQLRMVISLYTEAIAQMEAHHWEDALSLLQQIQTEQPGYADVDARITFIQDQQSLVLKFSSAEAAFDQGDYASAVKSYEDLRSSDTGFQHEIVEDHLFISYLQLGLAEETAAGSDRLLLRSALRKFEKALSLRPKDAQARGITQLLGLYLAGLDDFDNQEWSRAVSDLSVLYEARPEFADGEVARYLYEAYLAWGDELLENAQVEEALEKYTEAIQIRGVNTSEVEQRIALADSALATPTPEPPVAAPTAAASAGSSGGSIASVPAPAPDPFVLKGMSVRNNCSGFGYIHGVVWNSYSMPQAGLSVQAFNTTTGQGPLVANPTNGDGIYQIILSSDQIEGLWVVEVLDENDQPASQAWGQHLGGECVNGAQELKVDWQHVAQVNQ